MDLGPAKATDESQQEKTTTEEKKTKRKRKTVGERLLALKNVRTRTCPVEVR